MIVHAIVPALEPARRAVAVGATVLELRVQAPTEEVIARGRGFRALGMPFVVAGDVDAALELGADGVLLGPSDPGAERARARGLLLGRSVASAEEAAAVVADYLEAGPIWSPPGEAAAPPLGLAELERICRAAKRPVVAVGGVDASNAAACIRAGAAGVAAAGAALDPALRDAVDEALRAR